MGVQRTLRKARQDVMACALASAAAFAAAVTVDRQRDGPLFDRMLALLETASAAAFDAALPGLGDGRSAVSRRWQHSLQTFALEDRARAPAPDGIVFVGSSSISLWSGLQEQFPARNVIRRGLGGAHMADCVHHLDRLVLPYRPRLVVVYAGDNDLAAGVDPDTVLADFVELARRIHRSLPATRVAFVSIKPSGARTALLPLVRRTNALIAAHTRRDPRLDYIDVFTPMLNAQGPPRPELFSADALHLNGAGYAVWQQAISAHLD